MLSILAAVILSATIHVHDGDTIGRGPDRIRLWGIDAPELKASGGIASRDFLRRMISGRALSCDMIERDRYGRRVMRCALPNGTDIACKLLRSGHVVEWLKYSGGYYRRCAGSIAADRPVPKPRLAEAAAVRPLERPPSRPTIPLAR